MVLFLQLSDVQRKIIFALARKWRVSAKHGDVPNAYINAGKAANLKIYILFPQGMQIAEEVKTKLSVLKNNEMILELEKALFRPERSKMNPTNSSPRALQNESNECFSESSSLNKVQLVYFSKRIRVTRY